jgi:hypothetical protein
MTQPYSESDTRQQIIDDRLRLAGCGPRTAVQSGGPADRMRRSIPGLKSGLGTTKL